MMQPLFITARSIITALGQGDEATLAALHNGRSGLRPCDFGDVTEGYIGRVQGVEAHRLPSELARFDCRNNRLAHLALATDDFAARVRQAAERYGPDQVAVVVGTSTSGVLSSEEAYCARDPVTGALPASFDFEHTHDLYSLARFVRAALGLRGPAITVSVACASAARSFVDAHRLIAAGVCDAAVVGGADSLCCLTLRGFASLELISPGPTAPCDAARAGISIGEAAGWALLEREGEGVALLGYGVSSDGYHMSAPHPEGAGAIAAMRDALARAGLHAEAIDYVNLHGTGTKANDAMEDHAVAKVLGPDVSCSSTKGWTGHALGAAGIVEAGIAMLCIQEGFAPGCLGMTTLDPSFEARVLAENVERPVRRVMSNSFGLAVLIAACCSAMLSDAGIGARRGRLGSGPTRVGSEPAGVGRRRAFRHAGMGSPTIPASVGHRTSPDRPRRAARVACRPRSLRDVGPATRGAWCRIWHRQRGRGGGARHPRSHWRVARGTSRLHSFITLYITRRRDTGPSAADRASPRALSDATTPRPGWPC